MRVMDPNVSEDTVRDGEQLSGLFDALTDAGYWVMLRYEPSRVYIRQLAASRRGDRHGPVAWIRCVTTDEGRRFGVHPGLTFGAVDDVDGTVRAIGRFLKTQSAS